MWRGYECVALSILGHSPKCVGNGGESFSDEVERLAKEIPPGNHHLIGYSLGARLALTLAIRCPNRIGKLTLIGGTPGIESAQERTQRRIADKVWIDTLRENGIEAFVDAWQALPMWSSQASTSAQTLNEQRNRRLGHNPQQLAHALHSLGTGAMPPMWAHLSEIKIPVHLIVGQLDEKYTAIANSMFSRLSNATLSVIENTGHNPTLEKPVESARIIGLKPSL